MSHFIGSIKLTLEEGEGCDYVKDTIQVREDMDPRVKEIIESHVKAMVTELNDVGG